MINFNPNALYSSIAAICLAGTMLGMAQPEDTPPLDTPAQQQASDQNRPQREHPRGQRKTVLNIRINADMLRARLNRAIRHAEQMLERNKAALAKLDQGASPKEVLSEMKFDPSDRPASNDQRSAMQRKPGEPPRPSPTRLTKKERDMMHAFIRENFPTLWSNLQQIAKQDPRIGDRLLARMSPQIREILILNESQPELAKIKTEEMKIGLDFVEASRALRSVINNPDSTDSDLGDALTRVRALAAERFDVQVKSKQFEIEKLEDRLNELKQSVHDIEQRREAEIEHMVESTKRNAQRQRPQSQNDRKQRNTDRPKRDHSRDD